MSSYKNEKSAKTAKTLTGKKYVTIEGSISFREISQIMRAHGYGINHATTRNVYMKACRNFLMFLMEELSDPVSREEFIPNYEFIDELLQSSETHELMKELIQEVYNKEMKEEKKEQKENNV